MNTLGTVVVLGDPRTSAVGTDMSNAYRREVEDLELSFEFIDRRFLPITRDEWPRFTERLVSDFGAIAFVFSGQEDLLELVAYVSAHVGIPHNPPGVASAARLKDVCRRLLRDAGMQQPRCVLAKNQHEMNALRELSEGPWVVKPRDGRGSADVHIVQSWDEVIRCVENMEEIESVLVEEFVRGPEFSIEGVFVSGVPIVVAVTEKTLFPESSVEMAHQQPAAISEATRTALANAAGRALTALGAAAGLFHVEAWVVGGEVVVGEVHLRSGGDWIHTLSAYTRPDVSMFSIAIKDALGWKTPPVESPLGGRGAASLFLHAKPGRVESVHGIEQARSHPSALYVETFVAPGDLVEPLLSSDDRVAVVVTRGDSALDALRRAKEVASLISIRTS